MVLLECGYSNVEDHLKNKILNEPSKLTKLSSLTTYEFIFLTCFNYGHLYQKL